MPEAKAKHAPFFSSLTFRVTLIGLSFICLTLHDEYDKWDVPEAMNETAQQRHNERERLLEIPEAFWGFRFDHAATDPPSEATPAASNGACMVEYMMKHDINDG